MKSASPSVVLGDVIEEPSLTAITTVTLKLCAGALRADWNRCGLTADWLARYFEPDFDTSVRAATTSMLSTVLNELLENAAKFSASEHDLVDIRIRFYADLLRVEVGNTAISSSIRLLEGTLEDLAREPASVLFTRRIEDANVAAAPGIGLLIIKRDYGARLAASLTPRSNATYDVRVTVDLDVRRNS